jgi:hypothetical protein
MTAQPPVSSPSSILLPPLSLSLRFHSRREKMDAFLEDIVISFFFTFLKLLKSEVA